MFTARFFGDNMAEQMSIVLFMLICAIVLVIIAAIGITVIGRITASRKKEKPILTPMPIDDTTPITIWRHTSFSSLTITWERIKQDYLSSLPPEYVSGIQHALSTEHAWSGMIDGLGIALKVNK